MKRSEALKQLSREHHRALVLSKKLLRISNCDPAEGNRQWSQLRVSLVKELIPHFEEEETLLKELGLSHTDHHLLNRFRSDHQQIREFLNASDYMTAAILSERLKLHIRFEERELFNWLESEFGDEYLSRMIRGEHVQI